METWWLNRYTGVREPFAYGGDTITYEMGLGWLAETCGSIEDWGCGTAWGRRYVPEGCRYTGVDWSPSAGRFADVIADLRTYDPAVKPDGIFMRHILEHNLDWPVVLDNALRCFGKRFVLVLFTPYGEVTRPLVGQGIYDLSFAKADLTGRFAEAGVTWAEEDLATATQYGQEHVFYISRPS